MTLTFEGPFTWLPRLRDAPWLCGPTPIRLYDSPWLYEQPSASRPGLYLWTVESEHGYLVNHIGYSETSVADAMSKHFSAFFRGEYMVYDFKAFADCRKEPVYVPTGDPSDFKAQFSGLCYEILGMLCAYEVFYAVCEADRTPLERIKAALIRRLLAEPAEVRAFLDNAPPRETGDAPIELAVRTEPWAQLIGLGVVCPGTCRDEMERQP